MQLQGFCIVLIPRLSWAGFLYKSGQHQALLSQIHPRAAGLGWGSGALQLCLPAAGECHPHLGFQVCSQASSKQKIAKNNHQ